MSQYPQYDEEGNETISYQNSWRDIQPQQIVGAECFNPFVELLEVGNIVTLELSAEDFTEMFSALWNGAEFTYPDRFMQIMINFLKGLHCPPELENEDGCINFLPSASFVSFEPQDPYNEPDLIPDDYLVPPFFVNDEFEYPELAGYLATDVFINPASINIDPIDLLTLNLPQIKIRVYGSGQIELDLLAVALGSQVIVKVGSPPNLFDIIVDGLTEDVTIIDLNVDSLSIPPETDVVYTEEINIEAEAGEATDVYLVFVPNVDDSLIPLRYGGGIRNIGLCGFEQEGNTSVELIRFNPELCVLEYRIEGEWFPVENWEELAECLGGGEMATQEEITEAVVDAAEIISSRFLAGVASNTEGAITINPDGTISVGEGGVTEDDPLTVDVNEEFASMFGGSWSLMKGIELVFDKLDIYYGTTNGTPTTTEANAQTQMKLFFDCDGALMDLAVASYYTYRATNNRFLFDANAQHAEYMFCHGNDERAFNMWLVSISGFPLNKVQIMSDLLVAMNQGFWDYYYGVGLDKPHLGYKEAACVPSPTEVMNMPVLGTTYTTQQTWKAQHRLKLSVVNYFTDVDGDIADFWYYDAVGATLPVNRISTVNIQQGSGITKPTANQVPYRSGHDYVFTIDTITAGQMQITIPSTSMGAPVTPSVAGVGFVVTIEDLGEYVG